MDNAVCYAVYKGYCLICSVENDGALHGRVDGIRDIVTFHADSPEALQRAFEEAVDDYLAVCQEAGLPPDPPA
jgi:predicted HicB family RNase H-like nuclease